MAQSRPGSLGGAGSQPGRWGEIRRYVAICQDLAAREFRDRYRGSFAGVLGLLIVPLAFLATYSFVFTTIIPIRLREDASRLDYTFFLFVGLIAWNLFADAVARAPAAFANGAQFVRAPHFPASSLAVVPCVASYYQALVWLLVFAAASAALEALPPLSLLVAPLVLAAIAVLAAGVSLMLATVGVFFRDLAQLISPALTLAMFLSPVLYPAERLATRWPGLVEWNPVAPTIVALRDVMLQGQLPETGTIALALAWATGALFLALPLYRRTRGIIGDLH